MTFRAMAMERGKMSEREARRGVKRESGGREMVQRVSHVIVKWKAANESWTSLTEGSEKMALLVKTMPIVARVLMAIQARAILEDVLGRSTVSGRFSSCPSSSLSCSSLLSKPSLRRPRLSSLSRRSKSGNFSGS